jgi:hypothetical protein
LLLIQKHIQVLSVRMPLEGASKTRADDREGAQGAALRAVRANTAPQPQHLESRKRPALVSCRRGNDPTLINLVRTYPVI